MNKRLPLKMTRMAIAASLLPLSQFISALPSALCTADITSFTQTDGCLIPAPEGAPETADIGVKIYPPITVNNPEIATHVTSALDKVVVFVDGYGMDGEFNYPQKDSRMMGINDEASILHILPGVAGTETVQDYSNQIQSVISTLNQHRSALTSPSPMAVIGFSLGGIASRHALRTMEVENIDHQVGLYVSHDAPHTGVHVPQSVQNVFPMVDEYVQEITPWATGVSTLLAGPTDEIKKLLSGARNQVQGAISTGYDSAIFKQLLVNSIHTDGSPYREFHEEMKELGYPISNNIRKIAISNGTVATEQTGFGDDDLVVDFAVQEGGSNTYARNEIKLYKSKPNQKSIHMDIKLKVTIVSPPQPCWWWPFPWGNCMMAGSSSVKSPNKPKSHTAGSDVLALDDVPGSSVNQIGNFTYQMTKLAQGAYYVKSPFYDADGLVDLVPGDNSIEWSFIPTGSAIGLPIDSSSDSIQTAIDEGTTPFDLVIVSTTEEGNIKHESMDKIVLLKDEIRAFLSLN